VRGPGSSSLASAPARPRGRRPGPDRAYPWPAPAERDVAWVGRHTVHEGEHHLMDVRRVLAAVTAAS